jgi:hypothetical protein
MRANLAALDAGGKDLNHATWILPAPLPPRRQPRNGRCRPDPARSPVIRREDYRLSPGGARGGARFPLGIEATRVTATLQVERNPRPISPELRLNGDGLTPLSVTVDGAPAELADGGADLVVTLPGDSAPSHRHRDRPHRANTQLMGLYASNGMLCTQCEAEGFRRITFFPDRPDVLSTYTVRMSGDKAASRCCCRNGNCTGGGRGKPTAPTGPNGTIPGPSRPTSSRWSRAIWSPIPTALHHHERPRGRSATSGCAPRTSRAPATRWNR